MVTPSIGSLVLLPFPFSDLSRSKKRPAIVLASAGRDDWILCQVTSNPYGDARAVTLTDQDFARGSLLRTSYARPAKLFTANRSLLLRQVGILKLDAVTKIIDIVVEILRRGLKP